MEHFINIKFYGHLFYVSLMLFVFTTCKKKEEAKAPATTSGKLMIWETTATSSKYNAGLNIPKLSVFVNDHYIGYFESKYHWSSEPTCGATGSLTCDYVLGNSQSEVVKIEIRDYTTDAILQNGSDTILNNGCTKFEIK